MGRRLVVIGAGPIGIEAALLGIERGFDVEVLERDVVGASLRAWGPTRFFSPFGMNVSSRVIAALGADAPEPDALLTGPEFVSRVLEPIANGVLANRVKTGTSVVKVGRDRLLRRDKPGHPMRGERCFRMLVDGPDGESIVEADIVLDATGAMSPNYLGSGGVPAPGERAVGDRIIRTLAKVHGRVEEFANRRVLVVGHGHSAANAIALLSTRSDISVTWATRSFNRRPCVEVANDPLPERQSIVKQANQLAQDPPSWLTVERRANVVGFELDGERIVVRLSGDREGVFDAVISMVGHHPDTSIHSELAVEISAITEGAAGIQRALANVTDCLSVPAIRYEDLLSGEPGFFMIGYKSYGRMATFLLKDGITQLESIMDGLRAK